MYQLGERFLDRIDFEELALKGIDPSFGPSIRHPDFGGHSQDDVKNKSLVKVCPFDIHIHINYMYVLSGKCTNFHDCFSVVI